MGVSDFDTKAAIVVRDDLAVWQRLNVTAFLTSGIVAAAGQRPSASPIATPTTASTWPCSSSRWWFSRRAQSA